MATNSSLSVNPLQRNPLELQVLNSFRQKTCRLISLEMQSIMLGKHEEHVGDVLGSVCDSWNRRGIDNSVP